MAGIGQYIEARQGQQIVLTPQMRQSIDLLQKPVHDLNAMVRAEMEENPFLQGEAPDEIDAAQHTASGDNDYDSYGEDAQSDGLHTASGEADYEHNGEYSFDEYAADQMLADDHPHFAVIERLDSSHDNIYDVDYVGAKQNPHGSNAFELDDAYDQFARLSGEKSLRETIDEQINQSLTDPTEQLIAQHLIDFLDYRGYFVADAAELEEQLGLEPEQLDRLIAKLQQFEPTGIFARSLQECIALQLQERDRFDPAMELFVNNLEMLADGRLPELIELCGVLEDDVEEMLNDIRKCDVSPASSYEATLVPVALPDVIVRAGDKPNQWIIELTNQPRLQLNEHLFQLVEAATKPAAEASTPATTAEQAAPEGSEPPPPSFDVVEKYRQADFLISAIEHRGNSIIRVTEKILEWQKDFFRFGISHMRPMVLRDLAEELQMHESTVSRVCSKKYIQTPRGVFEMRFFFSRGIKNASGEVTISSRTVKDRIQALISDEPQAKPLSDGKLAAKLATEGINLARRTVTKYREELEIVSSVERKRTYAMRNANPKPRGRSVQAR